MRQRGGMAKLKKSVVFGSPLGRSFSPCFSALPGAGGTGGNASNLAEISAEAAVVERLTPICVAQFSADSQQALKLTEFLAVSSSSKRITFVADQGWATMPGET